MDVVAVAGGKFARVTTDDVIEKLRDVRFGEIRSHAVRVDGVLYPVKEAFAAVSGFDRLDFNTNQARTWFRKLGFEVLRVGHASQEPDSDSVQG